MDFLRHSSCNLASPTIKANCKRVAYNVLFPLAKNIRTVQSVVSTKMLLEFPVIETQFTMEWNVELLLFEG